jgi:hypothetical protein
LWHRTWQFAIAGEAMGKGPAKFLTPSRPSAIVTNILRDLLSLPDANIIPLNGISRHLRVRDHADSIDEASAESCAWGRC